MSTRKKPLSKDEIARAFSEGEGLKVPVVLTTEEAETLLRVPPSTFAEWKAKGRLDGTYRKRGTENRYWRDRLIHLF